MIKAVKSVVKFSANIIAGIGLVILCFGLFVLYNKLGQFYQDLYYNSADWLETLQKYGFIILGSVVFLIGCTGVYGSTKNPKFQKSCLIIYEIGAITFLIVCSALSIFTLVYSNDIIGEECAGSDYFQEIDSQIKKADQLLCSNLCQCYITLDTLNLNQKVFAGKNYTTQEDLEVKIQKVQECPTYQIDQYAASAQMIQAAEQLLHCTGWCNPSIYYLFSDINDDSNNGKSCFMETKEFVESTGKIMGYVLLGLGILFGLNVFFVILLCCKKEKRSRIDYLMGEV